jgi:hypothetical protein
VQNAAILEKSNGTGADSADRLRGLVLARIACCPKGVSKAEATMDLGPMAGARLAAGQWRKQLERETLALAAAGLITVRQGRMEATAAGLSRAAAFLGVGGEVARRWGDVRDVRLVAMALGLGREPQKRLQMLATPDGLRIAILEAAYQLKIKGVPTPARLREALAAAALKRAFGNKSTAELAGKLGLSPKASRLLAGQLSRKPRDFGTDSRLIATLAAECAGAASSDHEALRTAVLRQYFAVLPAKVASAKRPAAKRPVSVEPVRPTSLPAVPELRPPTQAPVPPALPASLGRPDLSGFAAEVRRQAARAAQGWSGDRKAYISHVWRNICDQHRGWNLSEIEFKCMLAEAHRSGQLALANADLRDKSNIEDVRQSAVVYRNAVFHFIRVDG